MSDCAEGKQAPSALKNDASEARTEKEKGVGGWGIGGLDPCLGKLNDYFPEQIQTDAR